MPPFSAELQRVEHRYKPESCQCAACGKSLVKIGEDTNVQLDVESARFFVHRHIRPQYAWERASPRRRCSRQSLMTAPGLLAWVAVTSNERIGARQGVPLTRSTLAEWIGKIGVALQPLSERLAELFKERPCLHADETPVRLCGY
jgi:transposase